LTGIVTSIGRVYWKCSKVSINTSKTKQRKKERYSMKELIYRKKLSRKGRKS
jgi:hypothetical protein